MQFVLTQIPQIFVFVKLIRVIRSSLKHKLSVNIREIRVRVISEIRSFSHTLPRYIMAHVIYRLNKKPKKNGKEAEK